MKLNCQIIKEKQRMYVVIDTETTGLNPAKDRIIEFAAIGLDAYGNKEWEWCSLINPERDTGHGLAVRIHQIYPSDVAHAPTFADFAGYITDILDGRAVIAHNIKYDLGMLGAEFLRIGVKIPEILQICTLEIARDNGIYPSKLENCCDALGIEMEGMHHALADARATWSLAQNLLDFSHEGMQSNIEAHLETLAPWQKLPVVSRKPVTRPILPSRNSSLSLTKSFDGTGKARQTQNVNTVVPSIETFSIDREGPESKYLAAVEWALEDREISAEQQQALNDLRTELRINDDQVHEMHMTFMRGLSGSMWKDGEISRHEQFDLEIIAKALGLNEDNIKDAIENPIDLDLINDDYTLRPDARVVFTGEMSISRSKWTSRAKAAGLRVTGSVSGKTDYLVVPSVETGSSKSRKARGLGVRVVSEQRFIRMIMRLE